MTYLCQMGKLSNFNSWSFCTDNFMVPTCNARPSICIDPMFAVNITVCGKKKLISNLSLSASRSCLENVLTANQLKKFYAIIGLRQTICPERWIICLVFLRCLIQSLLSATSSQVVLFCLCSVVITGCTDGIGKAYTNEVIMLKSET